MGVLPTPLLLSSGKAAKPGMLGEPLLGHLACHLSPGSESYFPIQQLTVHLRDTLREVGEFQSWDLRRTRRRKWGERIVPPILKSNQEQG